LLIIVVVRPLQLQVHQQAVTQNSTDTI